MDQNDREAIEELFAKLRQAEGRTGARDPDAEALIRNKISAQPAAAYYMAQTVLVQQQALAEAQRRIQELEQQGTGGAWGRREADRGFDRPSPSWGPWGGGGGFLAGAAQTAMGVAGGFLLGNLISDLIGGHDNDFGGHTDQNQHASDSQQALNDSDFGSDFDSGFGDA